MASYAFEIEQGKFLDIASEKQEMDLPNDWKVERLSVSEFCVKLKSGLLDDPIQWLREDYLQELTRILGELQSYADPSSKEIVQHNISELSNQLSTYQPLNLLLSKLRTNLPEERCDFVYEIAEWPFADVSLIRTVECTVDRLCFNVLNMIKASYDCGCIPVGWVEMDREHQNYHSGTMVILDPNS
ncbi:hypothetical protein [Neorhodopirellula pilleata]|uniref:Uncharacterized protein n=1 Tax=Neorhodopirellula pilleata TaxID=2714738 RepID=A0A5C6AXY2_9BACT|nr:hypothetical protein [Neorhodopirellula pilleata]TWU04039.1 hypothetical protein Pla100_09750 [Neorhodopirellula pilleata]